jgi:hypothetical protein
MEDNAVAPTRQPFLPVSKSRAIWAILICCALLVSPALADAQQASRMARVRSDSELISRAIVQGTERSPTFRRLIEAIDATDGLVYVLEGECGLSVRACLHMTVELARPNRLLRVFVNPRRAPGCELIASIGHELQHVHEVLSNRAIRSTAALTSFFHRIRPENPGRFETTKAIETGVAVEKEACSQPTSYSKVLETKPEVL